MKDEIYKALTYKHVPFNFSRTFLLYLNSLIVLYIILVLNF